MTRDDQLPADVLLLGTMHLANPGRDAINTEVDDVLAEHRQRELDELVGRLAGFAPTKVCVEQMPEDQAAIDSAYAAYRRGTPTTDRSEVHQIGFRLAKRCGLGRVHAIDADKQLDWEGLIAYLDANPDAKERFMDRLEAGRSEAARHSGEIPSVPIAQLIAGSNTQEALDSNLRYYVDVAGLGGVGEHGGADYAASWYRRNFRIFSNLCALTEPGDRLFVVFGAGHVPILRHLVELSSRHRLIDPRDFLN